MTTTKTAAKYKTPILTKGGMHTVHSEYFAPSTGHTIEIKRERGTPQYPIHRNTATVRDADGNYVRIPSYVRITQGSIAYHLFQLTPTEYALEPTPTPEPAALPSVRTRKDLESILSVLNDTLDGAESALAAWTIVWRTADAMRNRAADQIAHIKARQ